MQTARDFLVKANLAKPGRGKFSNEAKAHLKQAMLDGHKFSDWDENGRVAVAPAVKNKIEKRAEAIVDADFDDDCETVTYRRPLALVPHVKQREETQIVFVHPKWGNEIVLDTIGPVPVWAAEKILIPSWLEGYEWTLR